MSAIATEYDSKFFQKISDGSQTSAREVVPVLLELFHPKSVADVGCGAGAWLSVFQEKGIQDILGFDGDYVERTHLRIPQDKFQPSDLSQPIRVDRKFDLAISLEVAEHIDAAQAETYMDTLTRLSDAIVFSAAIPNQGGTHHVNEQWPEYWEERFKARGFVLIDSLRERFWNNRDVERWYRQNLLLYVRKEKLERDPVLQQELVRAQNRPLALVHPATWSAPSLGPWLRMLPGILARGFRRRFPKGQ